MRVAPRFLALIGLVLFAGCASAPTLEWEAPGAEDEPLSFRADPAVLQRALRTLVVGVRHPERVPPPMLGAVREEEGVGVFWPRSPWRRGITYRAYYAGSVFDFSLPKEPRAASRSGHR